MGDAYFVGLNLLVSAGYGKLCNMILVVCLRLHSSSQNPVMLVPVGWLSWVSLPISADSSGTSTWLSDVLHWSRQSMTGLWEVTEKLWNSFFYLTFLQGDGIGSMLLWRAGGGQCSWSWKPVLFSANRPTSWVSPVMTAEPFYQTATAH